MQRIGLDERVISEPPIEQCCRPSDLQSRVRSVGEGGPKAVGVSCPKALAPRSPAALLPVPTSVSVFPPCAALPFDVGYSVCYFETMTA